MRTLRLSGGVQRVRMLRERAGDPPASMTLKERGRELLAWVEDPGGLADVKSWIRIGSRVRSGRRGVRIRLPERFDANGTPFSVGFEGWPKGGSEKERGAPVLRRYLQLAPGARAHFPVDRHAALQEFEPIADRYPVFRICAAVPPAGEEATS